MRNAYVYPPACFAMCFVFVLAPRALRTLMRLSFLQTEAMAGALLADMAEEALTAAEQTQSAAKEGKQRRRRGKGGFACCGGKPDLE